VLVTVLGIGAATWGIVMALSPVLQIRRILNRRSSEDVSIGYFLVLLVGFAIWMAYGISIGNLVLIVPNSVAFCVGLATILIARRYR
jgi:MtN3 and saliva related transmembrane protein